ncbi:intradiol ring-cleavage dioxygenase [Croceicoccus bisphenolivorans]|uniref:dioxygenase family protein n=1 Tax=Croceicoccus bisphenolivorans TaxID=1783232 RepID=UPI0008295D86|nr:intradiol ring-cleavage dioxygenase [Croceicoccus bisphenolivorans]
MSDHHHHDGQQLARDIAAMERVAIGRRRALGLFGGVGATALLAGCGGSDSSGSGSTGTTVATTTPTPSSSVSATGSTSSACTTYASETNGPYPADGTNTSRGLSSNVLVESGVVRSDIRPSFLGSSTSVAEGVELTITITLADANNACAALAGYAVYIWHCDVEGDYSLYDLPNESYLRGVQVSDANGQVTFTTIWPGCYNGRFPHIHFEVYSSLANATSGRYALLISQFAMPDAENQAVYATSAYATSKSNYVGESIATDNVFGDNTAAQKEAMTMIATGSAAAGYSAVATVGIAT